MESQSDVLDDKKKPDHKKLTCLLCTKYFKEPRSLPCHHTFCSSCLRNICPKADDLSPNKKQKIVCPKCKAHFNIPPNGIEGFPIDHKAQAMKDKVIQDLAQNISRTLNQPKEDSRFSSTSPIGEHVFRGNKYSQNSTSDSENYTANSKESDYAASGQRNFSSRFGDFSKYAKYFSQESNVDGDSYRPTIRPDHTRVGYESSTRFRNRQTNSRERNSEEKDFKRRTWYGSTLHSRRAQSLNRTSMYAGLDDSERKPESLFKIAEDKEHTMPSSDGSPNKSTYGSGTPPLRKSTSEEERPNVFRSRDEIKSRYSRPTSGSSHTGIPETPISNNRETSEADDRTKFNPRSGLGGPSRPSLSTHKENVPSETFFRQDSKERKSPKDKSSHSGPSISLRTRKRSPKSGSFKDKKLVSPSASPRRQTVPLSPKGIKKDFIKAEETPPKTFVGSRHQRFQRSGGVGEQGRNESASRESFDFSSRPPREPNRAWSAASRDRLHLNINVEDPIIENHQPPTQKPSSKQSHSRKAHATGNSLNKDDFDSESEFREHLLNITMSKEKYQYIMGGLKDGKFERSRFCSTGSWDEPETPRTELITEMESKQENKENTFVDSNQLNSELGNGSNRTKEVPKKEPLLDDNLINSFRAKYMSSLDVKRDQKQLAIPEFADGVFKCWSYQKNDFGFPTSAAFLNSGNLVVADFGESCLEFFDSSGRLEHSVTGIKPFGVVATGGGKNIVVGDRKGKSIRVFDEFGADVSQIDDLGHPEWLSGMSVRSDGGLVLCDRARCKILVCNSAGEKLKEFGSFGSGPKQLCMADFLAVDSHDRIVVADSGNHCIKIFDSEGNHLTTIGSRGSGDGQFEWPKGIVVDENDNIIVADTLNRRVSLFSQDGIFVKHLMTSIFEPYNLAVRGNCLAILHYNLKGMSQYDVYNY